MQNSKLIKRPLALAVAGVCLGVSVQVLAADSLLEEVVVTAQKREQNLQDVPVSVSAYGAKALERLGITETQSLGDLVPGLEIQGSSKSKSEFFLRGVGVDDFQSTSGSAVAIYNDGIVFGSTFGTSGLFFDLERVEVLKGPQGTLWGKNTTAGLINIIPKKPEVGGETNGYVTATVGKYGQRDLEGAIGFSMGEQWAGRVSAKTGSYDGYIENVNPDPAFNGDDEGGYDDWTVFRAQLAWQPSDDLSVRFMLSDSDFDGDFTPSKSLGVVPVPGCTNPGVIGSTCGNAASAITFALPPGTIGTPLDTDIHTTEETFETFETVEITQGGIFVDYSFGEYDLAVILGASQSERVSHSTTHGAVAHISQTGFDDEHEQISAEVRLSSNSEGPLNWVLGLYYYDDELDYFRSNFFSVFGGSSAGRYNHIETTNASIFGEVTYNISEQLTLIAGLRLTSDEREGDLLAGSLVANSALQGVSLDRETWFAQPVASLDSVDGRDESWTEPSWRLTLSYALSEKINLWGTVSKGFRGGDFNGGAIAEDEFTVSDPEFVTAYEVGIKSDLLEDRLRLNASVFFYEYTDKIGFVEIPNGRGALGNLSILANFGDVDITGFEFEALWEPVDNLVIQATYAYIDSEYVDTSFDLGFGGGNVKGNVTAGTPENSFSALVNYVWVLGNEGEIGVQYNASWRDDLFFTDSNGTFDFQEDYWLQGANLNYTAPEDKWSVSLWVKNLADEEYLRDGFFFLNEEIAYAGAPRSYGLTATYNF